MKKLTLQDLYPSFAHLIWETVLIEGSITALADKTGIDGGTIGKWLRRRSKHPEEALLRKLVRPYRDLGDVNGVIDLIRRDALREMMGEVIPAPDLGGLRAGPKAPPPNRRRGTRVLGWLVAAAITTAWGSAQADARPVTESGHHSFLSEVLRRLRQAFPDRRFPDLQPCAA